jgi:hypothetical protein
VLSLFFFGLFCGYYVVFVFLYFLFVLCSCYPASVWIGLKGIARVMPLFESLSQEVRVRLKNLVTIIPLSEPCLTALIDGFGSWSSCQESIGPRHSFDAFLFNLYFFSGAPCWVSKP